MKLELIENAIGDIEKIIVDDRVFIPEKPKVAPIQIDIEPLMFDVYTDGASKGNPGAGGWGAVIIAPNKAITELSGGYERTTNNRMELMAVIEALKVLPYGSRINLYSDSKYIIDTIKENRLSTWIDNNWTNTSGSVKNKDLWQELHGLLRQHTISYYWVKGHADYPYNNQADRLAVSAAESDNKSVDYGYIN